MNWNNEGWTIIYSVTDKHHVFFEQVNNSELKAIYMMSWAHEFPSFETVAIWRKKQTS